jgi:hypothetical protein
MTVTCPAAIPRFGAFLCSRVTLSFRRLCHYASRSPLANRNLAVRHLRWRRANRALVVEGWRGDRFRYARDDSGKESSLRTLAPRTYKAGAFRKFAADDRACKALNIRTNNRETQRALVCIGRQIRAYRAQLRDMAPEEARTLAAAMPGVSHDQAAALLVGLCGKHFEYRDRLVAFVGLDVRLRQSGKWQGKQVIEKRQRLLAQDTVPNWLGSQDAPRGVSARV